MTKEQNDKLHDKAYKFEDNIKEILSKKDFDDFSFEFFRFITNFYFDHIETLEGSKE